MRRSIPLYEQVAESIRDKILSGKLALHTKLPSQNTLSEQYNVSLITIKRALLELVKEGLLFGQPGKGVFVGKNHHHPPALTEEMKSIGVLISNLSSPFYTAMLESIETEANKNNHIIIFSKPPLQDNAEIQQVNRLLQSGVKGFIIASRDYSVTLSPQLEMLWNQGIPMIFVSYISDNRMNYIGCDNQQGAYIATKHLLDLGYKNIAYVTPDLEDPLCLLRYRGYESAILENKQNIINHSIISLGEKQQRNLYEIGYLLGQRIVKMDTRPDAIFAFTDLVALGVKRAILEKGLKIPQDLAIVGFDDIPTAGQAIVPLTTIRQPIDNIGCLVLKTLLNKIDGDRTVTRIFIPPKLIIRDSCGASNSKKTQSSDNK